MSDDHKIPPDDRTRAPHEKEWPSVWEALERANKTWVITAPIVAIVSNWRAIAVVAAITLALNGQQILAILEAYLGKGQ